MKRLLLTWLTLLLFAGCASAPKPTPPAPAPATPPPAAEHVLILTAEGVDPAQDTAGYNAFIEKVTQAFAAGLGTALQAKGLVTSNVLDQSIERGTGQKLAIYSVRDNSKKAVVLELASQIVGPDERLELRVQYVEQEFLTDGADVIGTRLVNVLEQTYVLHSSVNGANPESLPEIANDYVAFLSAQGRL